MKTAISSLPSMHGFLSCALLSGLVAACSSDTAGAKPTDAGKTSPNEAGNGCGVGASDAGTTTLTLPEPGTPDGGLREAIVHVPTSYDSTKPAMLVLNFHGLLEPDTLQEAVS